MNDSQNDSAEKVHLVGIAGPEMGALAEFLAHGGSSISGSDLIENEATRRLRGLRVKIGRGHRAEQVPDAADLVVSGPAIAPDHVEIRAAERRGIERLSYPEMLGRVMTGMRGICVAGSHGKTITAAMVGWTLQQAGFDPSVLLGGSAVQLGGASRRGRGELFVAESGAMECGSGQLRPEALAILNLESERAEQRGGTRDLVEGLGELAARVRESGILVVRGEDAGVLAGVRQRAAAPLETFSTTQAEQTWWATDFRNERGRVRFRVFRRGLFFTELRLELLGAHNVANALAAIALCHWAGVGPRAIKESLEEFQGVERRCQFKGIWRGVSLVDDIADHPTRIRATLRACREHFGQRRLWCVFQPHLHIRTRLLLKDFAQAFGDADKMIVSDIYGVSEPQQERRSIHARRLVEEIERAGRGDIRYVGGLGEILSYLEAHLEPGDVLVTLGAGTIGSIADEFTRRRPGNRQAG